MDDFDVDDFNTPGDFITKDELRMSGPQRKRIASVEKRDGFKDKNGRPIPELVLIFSDGRKTGLRAAVNRDEVKHAYGNRTSGWIDKVVELYCDATVRNPQGAKVGGIRVRIPDAAEREGVTDFTSDLEKTADTAF